MITVFAALALALPCEADNGLEYSAVKKFVERVEGTPWPRKSSVQRIRRDDQGNVVAMLMLGITLSKQDFETLAKIESLEHLALGGTNVTDADLKVIRSLPNLKSLNLSGTEITDNAIDELMLFPRIDTLCMGNVNVSRDAVDRLKAYFDALDRRLRLGYCPRR